MHGRERQALTIAVVATTAAVVLFGALRGGDDEPDTSSTGAAAVAAADGAAAPADTPSTAADTPADIAFASDVADPEVVEVAIDGTVAASPSGAESGCTLTVRSVRLGSEGDSVTCLQEALAENGYYTGPVTGVFDEATFAAVESLQVDRKLYVDGVVGRESALSLGIWPDEQSLVIHTPPPEPGATDRWGYPLSSVAVSGEDAPPLPANSGDGYRVVYDRAGQRVWAVDENNDVVRSWLVAGSQYDNEVPGVHEVYSRSEVSTAWNGKAWLPKMIRWLDTERGAIGFHGIPIHVEDNTPYMTEAELGQRLSGGCQRQADDDAAFLWDFAPVGTTVVVI